jgi:hypothetical protein
MKKFYRGKLLALSCLFILLLPTTLSAQVIQVPQDYAKIQQAIDASFKGDTILVDRGIYYEVINFNGKAVTVASRYMLDHDETHIDSTIIDGTFNTSPDTLYTVYFVSGEDSSSFLTGFSIRFKKVQIKNTNISQGGAFRISESLPKLFKNKVLGVLFTESIRIYPRSYVSWVYFKDIPYRLRGSLYQVGETTIAFVPNVTMKTGDVIHGKPKILNIRQIDQIAFRRKGNLLKGGLVGAGLGLLIGVAIGLSAGDDPPCDNNPFCIRVTAEQKAFLAAIPCIESGLV